MKLNFLFLIMTGFFKKGGEREETFLKIKGFLSYFVASIRLNTD